MWGWFGGAGGQAKKDAPKRAILQLRSQLEMLNKREKHLETQVAEQENLARKNVSSNKNAAKAALRRKKQFEHTLEQTRGQVNTLESEIYSIEAANINKETLEAMKNASAAMKQIHGGLTIDKVDQTMEDLREQHAIGEEISEAITQSVGNQGVDDAELEDELEDLMQEQLENNLLKSGSVPADKLPQVPESKVNAGRAQIQEEEDEDEELRRLQKEMAM